MNIRFVFLFYFVMSSPILSMDPRVRAMIHQWKREQVQAELQKIVEKEEQNEPNYGMTLINGYKLSLDSFLNECNDLEKLRKNDYEAFSELVKKARDSNYLIKDEAIMEYLTTQWFIVPDDGKVQQTICNIILAGVHEENEVYMLYDPSSSNKSRSMFTSRALPAAR